MDLAKRQMTGVFAVYNIKGELADDIKNTAALEEYLYREVSAGRITVDRVVMYSEDNFYRVKLEARDSEHLERAESQMQVALYTLESMRIAHRLQTTMFKAA